MNHVCIGQKFRWLLQDVKVTRGADLSSYHHLVMATLKFRLKRCQGQENPRACYNMDHLKNRGTAARFLLNLTNRFQAFQQLSEDSNADPEAKWEHTKQMRTGACEEL